MYVGVCYVWWPILIKDDGWPFLVPHLYGRGTLVLGFETSLNSHFSFSLNPLKGGAHVGAHVFKGLEACLFNTTHRSESEIYPRKPRQKSLIVRGPLRGLHKVK